MTDPIITQFAQACGASSSLDLRVDLVDAKRRVAGTVAMPFALVGRDDACDVTLTDPEVNPRHAWLQVVGGRVLAIDLGSRAGLLWPGQESGSGWLDPGVPVRIGPFQLRLNSAVSPRATQFHPRYSPLQSDQTVLHAERTYNLEFRNGKRAKDRWTVNRLVTLVGRAPECKIRLTADDIAAYHCGLVLTPSGLWVVDLSGRGIVVNGVRLRVSQLPNGAELWIGRFLIGMSAKPEGANPSAPGPRIMPWAEIADRSARNRPFPPSRHPESAEDEVPLGVAPGDPVVGLPSSHIMADAFPIMGMSAGERSNPVLITGSGYEPYHRRDGEGKKSQQTSSPEGPLTASIPPQPASAKMVASLLREMGELHGQMLTQFEQSLGLMVRLCACLGPEQLPAMQTELAHIQELNRELGHLHVELARQVVAPSAPQAPSPISSPPAPSPDSTALHDWVAERINTLQEERQLRWRSLVGMLTAAEARESS